MNIALFNHPICLLPFGIGVLCVLLSFFLKKGYVACLIISGASIVATVLCCLAFDLPLYEIIFLVLVQALLTFMLTMGGKK